MEQIFFIKKDATLPTLRMELFKDGRNDFHKELLISNALQNCDVTFSMKNLETDVLKVSKSPAKIVLSESYGCEEKYVIEYSWDKRDTKIQGKYVGWFEINFNDKIYQDGVEYPEGKLIVPIHEELIIIIK